ncbi:helix-turn-helix domain-containing protein [Candidatus Micrarchaeota archaeon]|nr:helix-turn-helix domain-containing protein [Candidatus Micrarchaeota archaeon]
MNNVDLTSLVVLFNDFFTSVHKRKIDELLGIYPTRKSLYVSYRELETFDPELADKLISNPEVLLEAAEQSIREMNFTLPGGEEFAPHVRFINLPMGENLLIEQLASKNINELVSFKGVVTKRAEVMHRVKIAYYKCEVCDTETRVVVTKNFVQPKRCESCKKLALKHIEESSKYIDVQRAEVQELLERVKGGSPTAKIELLMEDDLVNTIVPGENVEIAGIMRLRPPLKIRNRNELIYTRYIEINSIVSLKRDFEEIEISKEDEKRILELSKDPNIEKLVLDSVVPGIYGHEEVKRALMLQLFGGTKGKTMQGGAQLRDDIHLLLIGDPGLAKCVSKDSEIILNDGSILGIDQIVEEVLAKGKRNDPEGYYGFSNHDLLTMDPDGKIDENKSTVFWKLKAPAYLYRFEMASGKTAEVTPTHPLFTTEDGLIMPKKAEELEIGEFIATPHILNIKGKLQEIPKVKHGKANANQLKLPKYLNPDFARLLGYLTGDGYVRRTTSYEISLTNSETELIEDFKRITIMFGLNHYVKKNGIAYYISVFSVDLGRILEKMGLVNNSFNKKVPLEIMKSPDYVLKEFIKAYFDCEAHVSKDGIAVTSASEKLLKQVQILLLRFGIISQLHPNYCRATNAKNHKKTKYYRLVTCGENAKRYFKKIGFNAKYKQKRIKLIPRNSNTNIDVVPGLSALLKDLRKTLGLSQFECGIPRSTYQHYERGDRKPSYQSLKKVIGGFKKKTKNQKVMLTLLEKIANADIFWDRIVKKEKIKPESEWVYDLQVDSVHNFVANGVFVHNSRFVQGITALAPKSIYVSGKSTTGVGLTISAEKDELGDGGWTLKAGALVLASGGLAGIDEFDKIEEEDRAALHEVMESGSVSVAKAGIVAKFRAKSAIVAAANPKYGRFDQNKNLAEQFDVPPTLLSRFDLIFPIVDVLDAEKDAKLAQHILDSHMGKDNIKEEVLIDRDLLRKYVAYARRNIYPKLTNEATEKIKEFYVDLRKLGKDIGSVTITPRYLEGLVRMAEANAKVRLSQVVEERDAEIAVGLLEYVMKKVMTDKVTGMLDVDTVATGKPKSERDKLQKVDIIIEIIKDHLKREDSAEVEKVISDAAAYEIDASSAEKIILELLKKGDIYEKEHGHVRLVGDRR